MPVNRPTAAELLGALREHLERNVQPELSGALAYENRVAVNVLKILEREAQRSSQMLAHERERLRALLDRDGDVAELNAELCDRIAIGAFDGHPDALLQHLFATTYDKLAIDNPRYAAYERAHMESRHE